MKKIAKWAGGFILLVLVCFGIILLQLSLTEYQPQETEEMTVEHVQGDETEEETLLARGASLRIMTWNIGYGALGDNADFFMDGGKSVNTASKERLEENLSVISDELTKAQPDIVMLQEADRNSMRSSHVDEVEKIAEVFPGYDYAFANNFKVAFVPYPIPPIGKVDSGIATYSRLPLSGAQRVALPVPFTWPVRLANLKRCLLVGRVLLADGNELVLVNLHLEAFDDGEGKIAQTRMLADFLNDEAAKGHYVIAGGDFNQIFSSSDQAKYPAREGLWQCGVLDVETLGEGWQFVQDDTQPSCRSLDQPYAGADADTVQYYIIDGFIVSDNIRVDHYHTEDLNFAASDHNPVIMDVQLL